jgi:hypothetical protein
MSQTIRRAAGMQRRRFPTSQFGHMGHAGPYQINFGRVGRGSPHSRWIGSLGQASLDSGYDPSTDPSDPSNTAYSPYYDDGSGGVAGGTTIDPTVTGEDPTGLELSGTDPGTVPDSPAQYTNSGGGGGVSPTTPGTTPGAPGAPGTPGTPGTPGSMSTTDYALIGAGILLAVLAYRKKMQAGPRGPRGQRGIVRRR